MPIASGIAKQVVIKKETAWAAPGPVRTGAQYLRRRTSTPDLRKETYSSEEMRTDYQRSDFRHGGRSVVGTLGGELAPGSYPMLFAAMLRRDFTAVTPAVAVSLTVAGTGPTYTVTRAAGSYITDGFRVGMVVRLTVGALNVNNINKNLLIVDLTATVATVAVVNGTVMQAEGPIAGCTVSAPGKVTYTPTAGHTDDSFAYEHWHSDISLSELFLGVKVNNVKVGLPPTGIATVDFDFLGKDLADVTVGRGGVAENVAYFTTPTAAGAGGVVAAVNGVVYAAGAPVALLTGLSFDYAGGMSGEAVVGSNTYPDISEGSVIIKGEATVILQDKTFRDYFVNETEVALIFAFSTGNGGTADFMSFALLRCKMGGATKDDGQKSIKQTVPFEALVVPATQTNAYPTTMMVQDSLA